MLAAMMNCRGLTELVLLTVGLKAGILDGRTFTVFVIMALVTTAATGPLLGVLGMPRTAAAPATSAPAGSSSAPSPRGAP
jgi:Kef-type K+ transport system membrane component KefB